MAISSMPAESGQQSTFGGTRQHESGVNPALSPAPHLTQAPAQVVNELVLAHSR